jgi:hypothetical protein
MLALLLLFPAPLAGSHKHLITDSNRYPANPGCDDISIPPPRSSFSIQQGPAAQMGLAVAKDAGKVVAAGEGRKPLSVIVFEEKHTSPVGQMEIALMLLRLERQYGLRLISLEGAMASKGSLPAEWFVNASDNAETRRARHAVALRMLRDGEIGSAEFIALVRPQVQVRGNEVESEYTVKPPEKNPTSRLFSLIVKQLLTPSQIQDSLTPAQIIQLNKLLTEKKDLEARDFFFKEHPWLRDRYPKLLNENMVSSEELVTVIEDIRSKSVELGIPIDSESESQLNQLVHFYCVASKRSNTIFSQTLAMVNQPKTALVALNIGAAHTPKMVELLKAAGASYVVISPLALATGSKAGDLTSEAFQRKQGLGSVDEAGLLGALLDGRKKLPVVLGERWYQIKSQAYVATRLLANAATSGGVPLKDDLKEQLHHLPLINIDFDSVRVINRGDQKRVVFQFMAKTHDNAPTKTIAVGAWNENLVKEPQIGEELDLEQVLMDDIKADRLKPVDAKIERTVDTKITKPAVKPKVVPVQISEDTKAVFSTDLSAVEQAVTTG